MRIAIAISLAVLLVAGAFAQGTEEDAAISQAAMQIAEKLVASAEPKSGDVVEEDWNDIAHPTIYVMLGSKDGVTEGTLLDIIEKGEPIKGPGGEILGFRESPAGTAKVTRVQSDKLSLARVETIVPGKRPGKGCVAYIKIVPKDLAVCAFQNMQEGNPVSKLGEALSEKLAAALQSTGKASVVSPAQVSAVLGRLKATPADLRNPEKSAAIVAELVAGQDKEPPRALVTGTIAQGEGSYAITVRVLEIGSGLPVGSAAGEMKKMAGLDEMYGGFGTGSPVKLDKARRLEGGLVGTSMGTIAAGGRLWDDCWFYPWDSSVTFDLRGQEWKELRADVVWRFQDHPDAQPGALQIVCDGQSYVYRPTREPVEVRVPLVGVRMLQISVAGPSSVFLGLDPGGILAIGDILLVPGH